MQINLDNKIAAWEIMRNLFPKTQLYPVIVACWLNTRENWVDDVIKEDLFCRFGYQYEPTCQEVKNNGISGLFSQIDRIKIQDFLYEKIEISSEQFNENLAILEQYDQEKISINLDYLKFLLYLRFIISAKKSNPKTKPPLNK
jgi:hypothetical protein